VRSSVRFTDNNTITAEGVGKVMITRKDGNMSDVLYVPNMKNNLLSFGQLLEKGYTMSMQKNHIEVYDGQQRSILRAPLSRNKTFKINLNAIAIQCLASVNV